MSFCLSTFLVLPKTDGMKADTALFLKSRLSKFSFFLPDKFIKPAALTFMSCRQSNTVLSCNISHRRYFSYNEFPMYFFPFSVAYVIVVHIIFYFSEDLKWHTRFAIETFIWRESRKLFYTVHYIYRRMSHKCRISAFK